MRPLAAFVACVGLTASVHAGIYSPNEPFLFEIDAEGFAKPIQYAGGFNSILAEFREVGMRPQAHCRGGDCPAVSRLIAFLLVREKQAVA